MLKILNKRYQRILNFVLIIDNSLIIIYFELLYSDFGFSPSALCSISTCNYIAIYSIIQRFELSETGC
jgi:hypothetical protein